MLKSILYFLLFIPFIGFGQPLFTGNYRGFAKNDSLGTIDIQFNLNEDSTYYITAKFEYYSKVFTCFSGQIWTYKGKWLANGNYIYFKPCRVDGGDGSEEQRKNCHCCDQHNGDFDFGEIIPMNELPEKKETKRSQKKEYKRLRRLDDERRPYYAMGYTYYLWADPASNEIFFYYSWDCHVEIWYNHSVKKL